jgi:predicted metal-dependent hydrolase
MVNAALRPGDAGAETDYSPIRMIPFGITPRPAPGDLIEVGGRPVRLAVNVRARRISLRLDASRREVVATAPSKSRLKDAAAFARSREGWIAARLDALPDPRALAPGSVLAVAGAPCRLERAAMRIRPRLVPATGAEPARLLASGEGDAYARAVLRALRTHALEILSARTAHYAGLMGATMPSVAVMDARARWGSCAPATRTGPARVRYVWRLILAPPFVLDYVAAHECAHLAEPNHGPRFWALVERLFGDHAPARAWLKAHGAELHAVG